MHGCILANSIKLFSSLSAGQALGEISRAYALLGLAVDMPLITRVHAMLTVTCTVTVISNLTRVLCDCSNN